MVQHRKGPPTHELITEYSAGATTVELAQRYGMTPAAVNRRMARAGATLRLAQRRSAFDDKTAVDAITSAYQSGLPLSAVAKQLSSTRETVRRALSKSRVRIRPQGLRAATVRVPTDPAKLGYLAGLLDGEGHLQIRRKIAGSVSCRMTIYSTTTTVMRWLLREVGGSVRFDTKRTERKGWLPIGAWNVYRARDVDALLASLLPLLLVKKTIATEILRLCRERFGLHDSPPTMTQSSLGAP